MTRQDIKSWAKQKLKGKWYIVLGMILLANLIGGITATYTTENQGVNIAISIGGGILTFFMEIGLIKYMVNFINDKEAKIELLFEKFKDWKQVILTYLLESVFVALWTLCLIIPGIIKGLGYSLVSYILADDSTIEPKDALKLSEEMMNGHKTELFALNLSFIGWHLLSILTLGILEIWVLPYQQTVTTKFLYDIKTNYEKANNPSPVTK